MLYHFVCAVVRIVLRIELYVRQSKISALSRAAEFASTYLGRNRLLFVEARALGDFLSVAFLISVVFSSSSAIAVQCGQISFSFGLPLCSKNSSVGHSGHQG